MKFFRSARSITNCVVSSVFKDHRSVLHLEVPNAPQRGIFRFFQLNGKDRGSKSEFEFCGPRTLSRSASGSVKLLGFKTRETTSERGKPTTTFDFKLWSPARFKTLRFKLCYIKPSRSAVRKSEAFRLVGQYFDALEEQADTIKQLKRELADCKVESRRVQNQSVQTEFFMRDRLVKSNSPTPEPTEEPGVVDLPNHYETLLGSSGFREELRRNRSLHELAYSGMHKYVSEPSLLKQALISADAKFKERSLEQSKGLYQLMKEEKVSIVNRKQFHFDYFNLAYYVRRQSRSLKAFRTALDNETDPRVCQFVRKYRVRPRYLKQIQERGLLPEVIRTLSAL